MTRRSDMLSVVTRRGAALLAVMTALVLVVAGTTWAVAATSTKTVKVCVTSKNVVRSAAANSKCPKGTKAVSINRVGPAGAPGATGGAGQPGAPGQPGAKGDRGEPGVTPTVAPTTPQPTATGDPAGVIDGGTP